MSKHSYIPYTDGGGPSSEVVTNNNHALLEALTDMGISAQMGKLSEYLELDHEVDGPDEVIYIVIGEDKFAVNFDRWGYVCDEAHMDQDDFAAVVAYFKNLAQK